MTSEETEETHTYKVKKTAENIISVVSQAINNRAREIMVNVEDGTSLVFWIDEIERVEILGDLILFKLKDLRSYSMVHYKKIFDIQIYKTQRAYVSEDVVFEDEEEIAL
ncbi:MAG: hypothetical protein QXP38_06815 [Nitrososphaerota archaeon]